MVQQSRGTFCRVIQIRCGYYHTVILSREKIVYTFGRNDYGQLGLGHTAQRVFGPKAVIQITSGIDCVTAGCYHTVLVGTNGMMYVFGRNNHGQLGTGDLADRKSPSSIDFFLNKNIIMVASGYYHTLVLIKTCRNVCESTAKHSPDGSTRSMLTRSILAGTHSSRMNQGTKNCPPLTEFEVALFILAHMHMQASSTALRLAGTSSRSFCAETFHLLLALLIRLYDIAHSQAHVGNIQLQELPYMITACLKILQAYLKDALQDSQYVITLLNNVYSVKYTQWVCNSEAATQNDQISMPHSSVYEQHKLNVLNGGGNQDFSISCRRHNAISDSFCCLQHQILLLVQTPLRFDSGISLIQEGAANVLFIGFELFYPCQNSQTQLLAELLKVHEILTTRLQQPSHSAPTTGRRAACQLLLGPLLDRLSNDVAASRLIKSVASDVNKYILSPPRSKNIINMQQVSDSVKTFLVLSKLLVRHLASSDDSVYVEHAMLKNTALSIQKHIFYWAAHPIEIQRPNPSLGSALRLAYTRVFSRSKAGVQCLIYYCHLVLSHSIAFITKKRMSTLIFETRFNRHQCEALIHDAKATPVDFMYCTVVDLHESSIGLLLRHILSGLLPFSQNCLIASNLLNLTVCISKLISACSASISSYSDSMGNAISRLDQSILWFDDLAKTVATLVGSLASTLMTTKVSTAPPPQSCYLFPRSVLWNLHRYGFKTTWMFTLVQHGMMTLEMFEKLQSKQDLDGTRVPCVCINSSGGKFVDSLIAGRGTGDRFCKWLRQVYCNFDPSYLIITHQAIKLNMQIMVWDIERAIAAFLLKHTYYEAQACLYSSHAAMFARSTHGISTPRRFLFLWSGVARITAWLWHRNSAMRASGSDHTSLFSSVLKHVLILVSFQDPKHSFDALIPIPHQVKGGSMRCKSCSRWQRVIALVRATIRWKKNCTHKSLAWISNSYRVQTSSEIVELLKVITVSKASIELAHVQHTLCNAVDHYHYAAMQHCGMLAFCELTTFLTASNLLLCVLYPLSTLLQCLTPLESYPLDSIWTPFFEAMDLHCSETLRRTNLDLHAQLCLLLRKKAAVVCTSTSSTVDVHLTLVLIATCGQISLCKDASTFEHFNTFEIFHKLLLRSSGPNCQLHNVDIRYANVDNNSQQVDKQYKQYDKKIQRCFDAVWALLRNLGVSLTCTALQLERNLKYPNSNVFFNWPEYTTAASLFRIYMDIAWRSLAKLQGKNMCCGNVVDLKLCSPAFPNLENGLSGCSSQHRRCQEIISTPMRLMNVEDGIQVGPERIISNPKGSDFSLTFWLFVSQNVTGHHRIILLRGTVTICRPIILVRDKDMRLEIGFSNNNSFEMERLTSKECVPLARWIHVGLVIEGTKVRLYLNGILDCQQIFNSSISDANSLPVCVGRLLDGVRYLECVNSSVDGYIAHLRYYTRALSPIHLRIVCDQGPPGAFQAGDSWCYQLSTILLMSASARLCRLQLLDCVWLDTLLAMMNEGTARIQQTVIRTLRLVLPEIDPAKLEGPYAIVPQTLFRLIGLALWKNSRERKNKSILPYPAKYDDAVNDKDAMYMCNVCLVATELMILFRHLLTVRRWDSHVFYMIKSALRVYIGQHVYDSTSFAILRDQFAALSLLGGHSAGIDPGTIVPLSDTGEHVCVMVYNHVTCKALVVNCGDCWKQSPRRGSPQSRFEPLVPFHINADRIEARLEIPSVHQGWTTRLLGRCLSSNREAIFSCVLNILQSFSYPHRTCKIAPLRNQDIQEHGRFNTSLSRAQSCTFCVKVLHAMSLNHGLLRTETKWPRMMDTLLRMSTQVHQHTFLNLYNSSLMDRYMAEVDLSASMRQSYVPFLSDGGYVTFVGIISRRHTRVDTMR